MAIVINGSGTITGLSAGGLPDGSVDSDTLATGIDATKLADGTVTSTELQYINTLSSNAQTQIDGVGGATVACLAYRTAAQVLTSSTWDLCEFTHTVYDTDSAFDTTTNYDFTVPTGEGGKYLIIGQVTMHDLLIDSDFDLQVRVNNVNKLMRQDEPGTTGGQGPITTSLSGVLDLSAADTVDLWVWHDDSRQMTHSSYDSHLTIHKLS